ncbi:hypothetical protein BGZ52_006369 [Haplosporangium bisporale]|nr:hypothetical protein BGZ52_006369 [Haplosporangium bisporale]
MSSGQVPQSQLTSPEQDGEVEDEDMDVDLDEDVQTPDEIIPSLTPEVARFTLATLKDRLGKTSLSLAGLLVMEQGEKIPKQLAKLRLRIENVKKEKAQIQRDVDTWTSVVHGVDQAYASKEEICVQGSMAKIHVKPNEKDLTVEITAEYPRFVRKALYDSVVGQLSAGERKAMGTIITKVRVFLYKFGMVGIRKLGEEQFNKICQRALLLACLDEKTEDAFEAAYQKDKKGDWSWERCSQVFVECALTSLEKAAEVDEFAKSGRDKAESYQEYANRMNRLVKVYKVQELPQCADITETMRMSVPSITLTVMELAETQRMIMEFIGLQKPDVKSLPFFLNALRHIHGPDDIPQWKAATENRKRIRQNGEQDEERQTESRGQLPKFKKTKFHHGKVNGSENVNSIPIDGNGAGVNQHQGQNRGQNRGPPFHNKTMTFHRQNPSTPGGQKK